MPLAGRSCTAAEESSVGRRLIVRYLVRVNAGIVQRITGLLVRICGWTGAVLLGVRWPSLAKRRASSGANAMDGPCHAPAGIVP